MLKVGNGYLFLYLGLLLIFFNRWLIEGFYGLRFGNLYEFKFGDVVYIGIGDFVVFGVVNCEEMLGKLEWFCCVL